MELAHPALFLIDGANLAYRSHFAMIRTPLITSWGANASALFGFVNALLRLVKEVKPEYIVVVQDPPGSTFRHEMYSGYKATRQKMPDDLKTQYPVLEEMIAALGVRTVMVDNYEADDVIGTLAKLAEAAGVHAYIVSGDKDMAQLVTERISIYNVAKQDVEVELLDSAAVREKFGVPPGRIVDLLALQGDSSDNIPGIAESAPRQPSNSSSNTRRSMSSSRSASKSSSRRRGKP
jgi:DNA polymerase-1